MIVRAAIASLVLAFPSVASADPGNICQSLQRRLAALPRVIGSTAEVRRHAEIVRQYDNEIRFLRAELRRSRCTTGSIIVLGQAGDMCGEIAASLREMEGRRNAVVEQGASARRIIRSSGEHNAIVAALERNRCNADHDQASRPVASQPQDVMEDDKRPYSSMTTIKPKTDPALTKSTTAKAVPPPTERPYDPSRDVRTVGPVFLPDDTSIDLKNPKSDGAQPRQ